MMLLAVLLQAAAPACPNPDDLAPRAAEKRCEGLALAGRQRWREAAEAFDLAARRTLGAKAARVWAQAGNAWLAAGEPGRAGTAFDAALVLSEGLSGFDRGELLLDRARAAVGSDDFESARKVMDQALAGAPADPLAWLLSATLARRMGQPARAATDIAEALKRAPEDSAVLVEAGNIAALAGQLEVAKERWADAAQLDPEGAAGKAAKAALAQFGPTGTR